MSRTTNPLRYPGAKRFLVDYIDELLLVNNLYGCNFFEPYAGSATVGIELLKRGHVNRLVLCEKDILLYSFWECVFRRPDDLCERIINTPITIETWHEQCRFREINHFDPAMMIELGFAGLFFNRTNFSGILNANPIGGINQTSQYSIDCRFNKDKIVGIIQQLTNLRDHVEMHYNDALLFMRTQNNCFLQHNSFAYMDPPYYEKAYKIYRHYYTNQNHIELARYVQEVRNLDWLISYDDAAFICGLYGGTDTQYQPIFLDYSCAPKTRRQGQELLISNLPLPPFPVGNAIDM